MLIEQLSQLSDVFTPRIMMGHTSPNFMRIATFVLHKQVFPLLISQHRLHVIFLDMKKGRCTSISPRSHGFVSINQAMT